MTISAIARGIHGHMHNHRTQPQRLGMHLPLDENLGTADGISGAHSSPETCPATISAWPPSVASESRTARRVHQLCQTTDMKDKRTDILIKLKIVSKCSLTPFKTILNKPYLQWLHFVYASFIWTWLCPIERYRNSGNEHIQNSILILSACITMTFVSTSAWFVLYFG